jgi:hypothetical protein
MTGCHHGACCCARSNEFYHDQHTVVALGQGRIYRKDWQLCVHSM